MEIVGAMVAVAVVGLFCWMTLTKPTEPTASLPADTVQKIGGAVGILGGSVAHAATARFALERTYVRTGALPTDQDIAFAAGMAVHS